MVLASHRDTGRPNVEDRDRSSYGLEGDRQESRRLLQNQVSKLVAIMHKRLITDSCGAS